MKKTKNNKPSLQYTPMLSEFPEFPKIVINSSKQFGTPHYLYSEEEIVKNCKKVLSMPNAFGIKVRYAMKANSNKTILKIISSQGLHIDASSLNEVRRANLAGIPCEKIMLTTQEVYSGNDMEDLKKMMLGGLKYNVCSLHQLSLIANFVSSNSLKLSIRIHPGVGSGESITRDTGSPYSCFGIHLNDLEEALNIAHSKKIIFNQVHSHIGSGGSPVKWEENIDRMLKIIGTYFPNVTRVSFGGGLKVARMSNEVFADIVSLGEYAKKKLEEFYAKTRIMLQMEIEPGTFIVANAGYLVTKVIDKKQTDKCNFIITDGGMEVNTRPLLYGSQHPFFIISSRGKILNENKKEFAVVGRCCESGDSQTLNDKGEIVPRLIAEPEIGDFLVIGGCGAYCSSMSLFNYNSHTQAPEVLVDNKGEFKLIRRKQTLSQLIENEL